MGVLNVENRVVARLFQNLGEIKLKLRVVTTNQHNETHHVLAHTVNNVAQGYKGAGAFRHLHRLAIVEQQDHLAELDVKIGLAAGKRLHGGLHAFHIATVVGAPDINHRLEAAPVLIAVIGNIRGEICPAAVRFTQRPIDVVTKLGGAEQCLRAWLPVVRRHALGRLQDALVDQPTRCHVGERLIDLAVGDQSQLRREFIEANAKCRQIVTNQVEHRCHGGGTELSQPGVLRRVPPPVAKPRGKCLPERHQIIPRIETFGNIANRLAKRFAIAQVGGPGEHVNLGAGIVDVIFARDLEAGLLEQRCQGIADDGAAPVPDMHRPGRIGRYELYIHRRAAAHRAVAVGCAGEQDFPQAVTPEGIGDFQIDEPGPGDLGAKHRWNRLQSFGKQCCQIAWLHTRRLGQHHGGIGCDVAMGRIARRFDGQACGIKPRRQSAANRKLINDGNHVLAKVLKKIHDVLACKSYRRRCSSMA